MIYFLGLRDDNVILYNSDLMEFKRINKDNFFIKLCGKSYSDVLYFIQNMKDKNNIDSLKSLLSTNGFSLSNYNELCVCLVQSKECKYLLETCGSIYMNVVTADLKIETEMRLNNSSIILNANTYWMTWPESKDYVYGQEVRCPAFTYVCLLSQDYLSAKQELSDFGNQGIADTIARYEMMGIDTGVCESKSLPGLLSWYCTLPDGEYDVVEIPEGVNVIDEGSLKGIGYKVKIKKLVFPESLLFVMPKSLNTNVEVLDFSKTNLTILNSSFISYGRLWNILKKLILPKCLKELCDIESYQASIYLRKSCEKLRFITCGKLLIESDSNIVYLGSQTGYNYYNVNDMDGLINGDYSLYKEDVNKVLSDGISNELYLKKLRFMEDDSFKDKYTYYSYTRKFPIVGRGWGLDDMTYGLKKRLSKVTNIDLSLDDSCPAYEKLKDLDYVTGISYDSESIDDELF